MNTFFLSVLRPIGRTGDILVNVLRVEVAQPLQWVREHADQLALRADGPGYCALWVSTTNPAPAPLP